MSKKAACAVTSRSPLKWMDAAESESAGLFNQQTTEFVGNGDQLSSPYPTPGTSLNARYLFRDYGPDPTLIR